MSRAVPPRRRLRNRLMLAFAGFTLLVAALFALYVVLFVYTVEDQLFETMLDREAVAQQQHHRDHGSWTTPRDGFMSVVPSTAALPDGIAEALRQEPRRREFAGGEGRHYHLRALQSPRTNEPPAWLVAEVSSLLVVRPMRAQLLQLLAWSGFAMVALALLLGSWLARRTTAPLSRLADAVGDATPDRLPPGFAASFPDDEVGVVARRLDDLIARMRDFVEREREFTRDASHELRTPLAVIRAASERLSTDGSLSADARASVEHVRLSATHLEQTVALLLALAREQTPASATIKESRVLPLLERVVIEQSPLLEGKQVQVAVDVPADVTTVLPAPVMQVLLANLIGNAFAHTHEGRIAITREADALCIRNPGQPIRDSDFAPFAKGEDSTGFGLGLSIVRRLCERHAIDLRFDREADGTTARLRLRADPVARVSAAPRTP
ncbi:Signal transduction histidine kinase [Pseudoxanthomonas sp. CF385]|uniref:sensor histidine kinase n=1 Tax=Pseudoxanthomonas sp. CF385 TaxID=1881042 RepID=UPI00088D55EA|nr:HAMP domain-containing sensor histidine kinase [Pseudoxanthomonas sp. CF385]SDR01693.1 Signal transduction histidine kinase [Pseudoxanthomonas sp. CF385]